MRSLSLLCLECPVHFVGLIQMQFSPSFDCNWGKLNDTTACWHRGLSYPPDSVGGVTESPDCVGSEVVAPPLTE